MSLSSSPRNHARRASVLSLAVLAPALFASSCSSQPATPDLGPATFYVHIDSVNGNTTLPTADNPLHANDGTTPESWAFTIEAHTPTGTVAADFNGYVRLSLAPGTVIGVTGTAGATASGRNILLQNGQASGVVQGTAVYGPARLWVEDLGYVPAAPGTTPKCSNGIDDNNNGLIDYPADPGCFYADDDTEDGGSYAAGVSPPVEYSLPTISDVRGEARTPYPNEAIEIASSDPDYLVVTRISSSGFFVTDVGPAQVANGYNSLYAYNFSTPENLRVCDRVTYLGGTANDFFGFTQLSFPSFRNTYVILGQDGGAIAADAGVPDCKVPAPQVLTAAFFTGDKNTTSKNLYKYESSLVQLQGFAIAANFGPTLAKSNLFKPGQSNCDFNGDGQIDYTETSLANNCPVGECEGDCSTLCDADVDCTEWTAFSARNEVKLAYVDPVTKIKNVSTLIKMNVSTVATFDPVGNAGNVLPYVTGTLTEFSGGTLNWTVEVRCPDDLVCPAAWGCTTQEPIPTTAACVAPRTIYDNDQGTN